MRQPTVLYPNWKAAATAVPDSEALESSFASMAYPIIQQKARALLKPGYVIGFEVVYKNAPDNNRLVGIMACKINKTLLYIPAFFVNGVVKGIDSIYEYSAKTFKPLNEGWVQFFLERNMDPIGRPIPKSMAQRAGARVDMGAFGAGMFGKSASAGHAALLRDEGFDIPDDHIQQAWGQMKEACLKQDKLRPILAMFAAEAFTDTDKGLDFLEKMASTPLTKSLLMRGDILPEFEKLAQVKIAKQASAVTAPRVTLHTGLWNNTLGVDSKTYYTRGYHLKQSGETKAASEVLAYKEIPYAMELDTIGAPGVYEIQTTGGKTETAIVVVDRDFMGNGCGVACSLGSEPSVSHMTRLTALVPSKKICIRCGPSFLFGVKIADAGSAKFDEYTSKSLPKGSGEVYVIDGCGRASRIWGIHSRKEVDGVTIVNGTFSINPDEDKTKLERGIVGKDARFFQTDSDWTGADAEAAGYLCLENLPNYIRGDKWTEIKITADAEGGKATRYRANADGKVSPAWLDPAKFAHALASRLDLDAEQTMSLMDTAKTKGSATVLLKLTKEAGTALRVVDQPVWQEQYDDASGAEIVQPQSFNLRTEFSSPAMPTPLPGDRWDPAKYYDTIMSETPEKLYQMANDTGAANLFDHGVVGALTKSKDVGALADTYLDDLVGALDKLCRMKFLLAWSPEDFKEAYGTDDLIEKEIELQSLIGSFGDLVLDVMRRVRDRKMGDPSLLASSM